MVTGAGVRLRMNGRDSADGRFPPDSPLRESADLRIGVSERAVLALASFRAAAMALARN